MKILPFSGPTLKNPHGRGSQSLSLAAENASPKPTTGTMSTSGTRAIKLENLLASQAVSPEDLGAAGELVKALVTQITAASPQKVNNIHKLDGVLYYFQA